MKSVTCCFAFWKVGVVMDNLEYEKRCPTYHKYCLTIKEAVEYFNLGEKTLYRLVDEYKEEFDSFVLTVGKKYLIKREKFSEFLDNTNVV